MLIRYWFRFSFDDDRDPPPGTRMGCGVTTWNLERAIAMVRERIFAGRDLPRYSVVENIDISTLDQGHVIPNMGVCVREGIWFPLGYEWS